MPPFPVVLVLRVSVAATAEEVFAVATDWDRQGEWMLATTVRSTARGGQGVGGRAEAYTGVGPVGFLDPMEITRWEPPYRCDVRHLGRVVRGTGVFEVEPRSERCSVFVWREDLLLPLGALGRAGWYAVRPLVVLGLRLSLRRFARSVAAGRPAS